jgi:hypothetical protein
MKTPLHEIVTVEDSLMFDGQVTVKLSGQPIVMSKKDLFRVLEGLSKWAYQDYIKRGKL